MAFDFLLAILADIVNFVVVFYNFLFFMVVKMLSEVLESIGGTDRVDENRFVSVLVGAS